MVTGPLTDTEARRLSGDGATTAPDMELAGTSEGTLARGSYRRSRWGRLSTLAVVNDDGTRVTAGVEALLEQLVAVTKDVLAELKEQTWLMRG